MSACWPLSVAAPVGPPGACAALSARQRGAWQGHNHRHQDTRDIVTNSPTHLGPSHRGPGFTCTCYGLLGTSWGFWGIQGLLGHPGPSGAC